MSKQAHLADGTVLEFPDETPDDVIDRTVKQHVSGGAEAPSRMDPKTFSSLLQDRLKTAKSVDDVHAFVKASGYGDSLDGSGVDQAYKYLQSPIGKHFQGNYPINVKGYGVEAPANPYQPEGVLGNAVRSLANGVTAGLADPAAAAMDAVAPMTPGASSIWQGKSFGDAFQQNRAFQLGTTQANMADNPLVAMGTTGLGAAALMAGTGGFGGLGAAPGAGVLSTGAKVLPDAVYGGVYGGAQSQQDTPSGIAGDVAKGFAGGAAGSYVGNKVVGGAGKLVSGITDPAMREMAAGGVKFTPGQLLGGAALNTERKLTSFPIAGGNINNRLAESNQGWFTHTLNKAIEPIAGEIPNAQIPEGVTGADAIAHGQKAFGAAYDQARAGMQFSRTPAYDAALTDIKDRVVNGGTESLSDDFQRRFNNVLANTVERRMPNGDMSGDTLKTVQSQLSKEVSKFSKGGDVHGAEYAAKIKEVSDALDTAARAHPGTDPAAVALMDKADQGYRMWALAEEAAARPGGEVGTATPTQYLAAVKKADKSPRNRAFSAGNAFGQDTGQEGQDILGKSVPNSFTADRSLLANMMMSLGTAGGADFGAHSLGAGSAGHSLLALPALDALTALAYSKPVNSFINRAAIGGPLRAKVGQAINDFAAPIAGRLAGGAGASALQNNGPVLSLQSMATTGTTP